MGLTRAVNALAGRIGYYIGRLPPAADSLSAHVVELLRHFGVRHVLDVGAHHGEYGRALRNAGYDDEITSFEPVHTSFERLATSAAGDPRWRVLNLALGDRDGELDIGVASATQLSSFLPPNDRGRAAFGNKVSTQRQERVSVRRLDSLVRSELRGWPFGPTYLKLDTQGYNLKVLHGAGSFLPHVVALQCEMALRPIYENASDWQEDLAEFRQLGFVPSAMFPVAIDREFRALEIDCVMVRDPGART